MHLLGPQPERLLHPAVQGLKTLGRISKHLMDGAISKVEYDIEFGGGDVNAQVGTDYGDQCRHHETSCGYGTLDNSEETACVVPISLVCKLISNERLQIPFDLVASDQQQDRIYVTNSLVEGRGQIHCCWVASWLPIVVYPSSRSLYNIQGARADDVGRGGP
jgi:hypothetical protein